MAEKIDAIKEELTATPTEALEAFVEKYASDSRTGVQKLVDTAKKRMDKLQKEMIRTENLKKYEKEYDTYTYICGIDEVVFPKRRRNLLFCRKKVLCLRTI